MIIGICGYANAGKTTAVKYLAGWGYEPISTSECVHSITRDILDVLKLEISTQLKDETILFRSEQAEMVSESEINTRNLLIGVAENVLVKNFGRRILSEWIAKQILPGKNYVVELFNQEEYDGIGIAFDKIFHISAPFEQRDADGREIISGAVEISNTGSLSEFYRNILFKL